MLVAVTMLEFEDCCVHEVPASTTRIRLFTSTVSVPPLSAKVATKTCCLTGNVTVVCDFTVVEVEVVRLPELGELDDAVVVGAAEGALFEVHAPRAIPPTSATLAMNAAPRHDVVLLSVTCVFTTTNQSSPQISRLMAITFVEVIDRASSNG